VVGGLFGWRVGACGQVVGGGLVGARPTGGAGFVGEGSVGVGLWGSWAGLVGSRCGVGGGLVGGRGWGAGVASLFDVLGEWWSLFLALGGQVAGEVVGQVGGDVGVVWFGWGGWFRVGGGCGVFQIGKPFAGSQAAERTSIFCLGSSVVFSPRKGWDHATMYDPQFSPTIGRRKCHRLSCPAAKMTDAEFTKRGVEPFSRSTKPASKKYAGPCIDKAEGDRTHPFPPR